MDAMPSALHHHAAFQSACSRLLNLRTVFMTLFTELMSGLVERVFIRHYSNNILCCGGEKELRETAVMPPLTNGGHYIVLYPVDSFRIL